MPGRDGMGSRLSYGLGGENDELPTFLRSELTGQRSIMRSDLRVVWGSGFTDTS